MPKTAHCWDCGVLGSVQDGHVIPRNLFARGARPSDLITLPECAGCNQGASKDEEYFLVAILAQGSLRNSAAQRRLVEMRTSRRDRTGLAKRFISVLEKLPQPVAGIAGRFPLEVERAERVIRRIVRGLYKHHFKVPLPSDHPIAVFIQPAPALVTTELYRFVSALPEHTYGARVFSFRFRRSQDGSRSAWLLRFYDAFDAFVVEPSTMSTSEKPDAADARPAGEGAART